MEKIGQIRVVSVWIFILPLIVLNLCLFISINHHLLENTIFVVDQTGRTGFTLPYIDGSVSISRTARGYPTYLIFKPGMIITAILLIKYWKENNEVINIVKGEKSKNNRFMIFGILSAIFLILHSVFLGVKFEYEFYQLFRRIVLLGFIIFEIVAQTLLVINLFKIKSKILELINNRILVLKMILVSILVIAALASLPILSSEGNTQFKHALEWNYFVGVVTFYLLTFLFWKNKKT